jgi:hypothetical protein
MNKLFLVVCVMAVSTAKAQLISGGLFRQQVINSKLGNASVQGLELSNTHYLFSVNAGYGAGANSNKAMQNSYLAVDLTPTGFHHAYLAHKFAPLVGVQMNKNTIKEMNYSNNEVKSQMLSNKNTVYSLNLGFKYSSNRMIFSGAYLMGKNEKAIAVKLAYVFAITHKCLKKRMYPIDFSF